MKRKTGTDSGKPTEQSERAKRATRREIKKQERIQELEPKAGELTRKPNDKDYMYGIERISVSKEKCEECINNLYTYLEKRLSTAKLDLEEANSRLADAQKRQALDPIKLRLDKKTEYENKVKQLSDALDAITDFKADPEEDTPAKRISGHLKRLWEIDNSALKKAMEIVLEDHVVEEDEAALFKLSRETLKEVLNEKNITSRISTEQASSNLEDASSEQGDSPLSALSIQEESSHPTSEISETKHLCRYLGNGETYENQTAPGHYIRYNNTQDVLHIPYTWGAVKNAMDRMNEISEEEITMATEVNYLLRGQGVKGKREYEETNRTRNYKGWTFLGSIGEKPVRITRASKE